jgi:hypothetical protein
MVAVENSTKRRDEKVVYVPPPAETFLQKKKLRERPAAVEQKFYVGRSAIRDIAAPVLGAQLVNALTHRI